MRCPKCDGNSLVKDSRKTVAHSGWRRRRECKECGWRFSTVEVLVPESGQSEDGRIRQLREAVVKGGVKEKIKKKPEGTGAARHFGKDRVIGSLEPELNTQCKFNETYACVTNMWSKKPGMKAGYCPECVAEDCLFGGTVMDRCKGRLPETRYVSNTVTAMS